VEWVVYVPVHRVEEKRMDFAFLPTLHGALYPPVSPSFCFLPVKSSADVWSPLGSYSRLLCGRGS